MNTKVAELNYEQLAIAKHVLEVYSSDPEALNTIHRTEYQFMTSNSEEEEAVLTKYNGPLPEQSKDNIYPLLMDLESRLLRG